MKRFERIASVVTKQSRAQKPRTRLVRRLTLILALTFFIFPVLTLAQKVPPVGQPPIQRQPPPPLPDLVPWAGEVSPNFCAFSAGDLSSRGGRSGEFSNIDLFVFVKNQWGGGHGGGDAPASMARVEFKVYGGPDEVYWKAYFKPAPPLLKQERNQYAPLIFGVPKGVIPPSYPKSGPYRIEFIITVDSGNQVKETHESNNHVMASCLRY
jgi:hypothetical protein